MSYRPLCECEACEGTRDGMVICHDPLYAKPAVLMAWGEFALLPDADYMRGVLPPNYPVPTLLHQCFFGEFKNEATFRCNCQLLNHCLIVQPNKRWDQ